MTDFFADLEQELRAAHPRRLRPAVPAGPVLMAAVALVAVLSVVSLLPAGEREVAQQPPTAGQALPSASCSADMQELARRLPVFAAPPVEDPPISREVAMQGQYRVFLEQARVVDVAGAKIVVYPACGTTVCLARVGDENTACGGATVSGDPDPDRKMIVVTYEREHGGEVDIVGLVTQGVTGVRAGDVEAPVENGVFSLTIPAGRPAAMIRTIPPS